MRKTSHQESVLINDRVNDKATLSFDLINYDISGDIFTSSNPILLFNSTIKLEFSIQNVNDWAMEQVEVQVKNDQMGVVLFNAGPKKFSTIGQGEDKPITYEYSIAEEFNDHELKFEILITYQYESLEQEWEIKREVTPYSRTSLKVLTPPYLP